MGQNLFKKARLIQEQVIESGLFKSPKGDIVESQLTALQTEIECYLKQILELEEKIATLSDEPVKKVLLLFDKFHQIATQLRKRREDRTTLLISDEYDVQDLLHSLLRIYFRDVRAEEWCPSYAGNSYRTDFLLKKEKIVIEAKITRGKTKNNKRISEELILDIAHYRKNPACQTLMCFIYDPGHLINNPHGFEKDIETDQSYPVVVRVNPKP